jgi:type II secretion system protein G
VRTRKISGFTIVELLIVIVVIGILAAITIVAYNGVQTRARVANAQADLRAITRLMEMYKVDNGVYPAPGPELEQVLRAAKLYQPTRWTAAQELAGESPKKSFMFCIKGDKQHYAVIAKAPIYNFTLAEQPAYTGQPLYYVSSLISGPRTLQWDSTRNTAGNLCVSVDPSFDIPGDRFNEWSYGIPTANAP